MVDAPLHVQLWMAEVAMDPNNLFSGHQREPGPAVVNAQPGEDLTEAKSVINTVMYGTTGEDAMLGNIGNDTLWGYEGSDVLWGGESNDVLVGGAGDDYMDGGAGADMFLWTNAPDMTGDLVVGFEPGQDKLVMDAIPPLKFIGFEMFSADGSPEVRLWVEEQGRGRSMTHVFVDSDGDGNVNGEVMVMNTPQLWAGDFIL